MASFEGINNVCGGNPGALSIARRMDATQFEILRASTLKEGEIWEAYSRHSDSDMDIFLENLRKPEFVAMIHKMKEDGLL